MLTEEARMKKENRAPSRRNILTGAGVGIATGIGSSLLADVALAATPKSTTASSKVWSNEYWAAKNSSYGEVKLNLFRKRTTPPKAGEPALPVLFLVHGSSNSSRTSFDLTVPGHGEYSVMNTFAQLGFDVWTMDHENYGRSSRTDSNSNIASGVEDLKAGIDVIVSETGRAKVHIFGESSGGLRAGAYA